MMSKPVRSQENYALPQKIIHLKKKEKNLTRKKNKRLFKFFYRNYCCDCQIFLWHNSTL